MTDLTITTHATERYLERFAGNLSWPQARQRLRRLLKRARFIRVEPGGARLYGLGEMRFLVCRGVLVTVYRPTYQVALPTEDLWCTAV